MQWPSSIVGSILILSIFTLIEFVDAAKTCQANNCNRAITGTVRGSAAIASRMADCSSFLQTTYVPPLSVSFTYITIQTTIKDATTTYVDSAVPPRRRAATKVSKKSTASIPAYASACRNAAQYSSACSCYGITPRTSTAPTPITTFSITIPIPTTIYTRTSTITGSPPVICDEFSQSLVGNVCVDKCQLSLCGGDQGPRGTPCGPSGSGCLCNNTQEYGRICLPGGECGQSCDDSSQCPEGYVCGVTCACQGTCQPLGVDQCNYSGSPTRLFKIRK